MLVPVQLLMDYHASRGYLVLSPDYFYADELSKSLQAPGFDLMTWIGKRPVEASLKLLKGWIDEVKQEFGALSWRSGTRGGCC